MGFCILHFAFCISIMMNRTAFSARFGPRALFGMVHLHALPGAPLVQTGPYRYLRHPNYWVVVGEIAVLPLVFGEIAVAIVFSILNAGMIAWRIRAEDAALADRRGHIMQR